MADLWSAERAVEDIVRHSRLMDVEEVRLADGLHRVCAQDVKARRALPPFRASAMDGYATRAQDLDTLPVHMPVVGSSRAGSAYDGPLPHGACVRVYTGARLPEEADTIVLQEATRDGADASVWVDRGEVPGRFIRPCGSDFAHGDVIAQANECLDLAAIATLAAAGIHRLRLRKRPRVGLFCTGDELREAGADLARSDELISTNDTMLTHLVQSWGGVPLPLAPVGDDLDTLCAQIEAAMALRPDLLVLTGGASVGDYDLTPVALKRLGARRRFHGLAVRPGKPTYFGLLGEVPALVLPGNPASSFVGAWLFVEPFLRTALGRNPRQTVSAHLARSLEANQGSRTFYARAHGSIVEACLHVTPRRTQDSFRLSSLRQTNALIVQPAGSKKLEAGTRVETLLLNGFDL